MHTWNWFTGVRAGAHGAISSSTELKFNHLFCFQSKKIYNFYFTSQGKKSQQSIFSTGRVGLRLPRSHPRSRTQRLVSPRGRRKWNAHVSVPLSPSNSLEKPLFCFSHEPSQDQKTCQGGGYLLYLFSEKLCSKFVLPQPEESFGKAML